MIAVLIVPGEQGFTREDAISRSRRLLRYDYKEHVNRIIDEVRSPSACPLAAADIRQVGDEWEFKTKCRKSDDICERIDRIGSDPDRWRAGAEALLESDDDKHQKIGEKAMKFFEDPADVKGQNCWSGTGDLSIAMDCDGEHIVATDKSFGVMGPAMGFDATVVETD